MNNYQNDYIRQILFSASSSQRQSEGIPDEQILRCTTAFADSTAPRGFSVALYWVTSGCLNDERLIAERNLPIEMIKDQPLVFFDPFFGRSADSVMKVAIAAFAGKKCYLIVDKNGDRTVDRSGILTANDTTSSSGFYACHIYNFLSSNE